MKIKQNKIIIFLSLWEYYVGQTEKSTDRLQGSHLCSSGAYNIFPNSICLRQPQFYKTTLREGVGKTPKFPGSVSTLIRWCQYIHDNKNNRTLKENGHLQNNLNQWEARYQCTNMAHIHF